MSSKPSKSLQAVANETNARVSHRLQTSEKIYARNKVLADELGRNFQLLGLNSKQYDDRDSPSIIFYPFSERKSGIRVIVSDSKKGSIACCQYYWRRGFIDGWSDEVSQKSLGVRGVIDTLAQIAVQRDIQFKVPDNQNGLVSSSCAERPVYFSIRVLKAISNAVTEFPLLIPRKFVTPVSA